MIPKPHFTYYWETLDPILESRATTYHQRLKVIFKGRRVHNATESQFQREETHYAEASYFDKLAEEREVTPNRPRCVALPAWEAFDGQELNLVTLFQLLLILLDPKSSRGQTKRRFH